MIANNYWGWYCRKFPRHASGTLRIASHSKLSRLLPGAHRDRRIHLPENGCALEWNHYGHSAGELMVSVAQTDSKQVGRCRIHSSCWSVHWTAKSFPFTLYREKKHFPLPHSSSSLCLLRHWFSSHVDYLQSFQERSYFHFNKLIIKGVKSLYLAMRKFLFSLRPHLPCPLPSMEN